MAPILGIWASSAQGANAAVAAFDSIATYSNNNASSNQSFTFSSIPQTYTHLQLRGITQQTAGQGLWLRFNGDTGANYSNMWVDGYNSGYMSTGDAYLNCAAQSLPDPSSNPGQYQGFVMDILFYKDTNRNKTVKWLQAQMRTSGGRGVSWQGGMWVNTSAINSITVSTNNAGFYFSQYTEFNLYGIKSA